MEENHRVHWPPETGEEIICKTLHRKLTNEQHDTNPKIPRVNSGDPEGSK